MKLTIGLFGVMLMICSSFSLPAGNPNDDAEIINTSKISENLPQSDVDTTFKDFDGVIETKAGDPYYYPVNPFQFLSYFQDYIRSVREGIASRIWSQFALGEDGDIDESKKNSTSVIKVVDGHRIEINETVYNNDDDNGNGLFKVRVIQVRTLNSDDDLTTVDTPLATYDVTNTKTNSDNEVTDSKEQFDKESSEIFNSHDHTTTSEPELPLDSLSENDDIDEIVLGENLNNKNSKYETNFYTIIDANQNLQSEKAEEQQETTTTEPVIIKEDVIIEEFPTTTESQNFNDDENIEELPTATTEPQIYNYENENVEQLSTTTENILFGNRRESLENDSSDEQLNENLESNEWDTLEDNNSDIEMFEPVEVDLSNDIYVNDLLADQGVENDPDAEVFSDFVINFQSNNNSNITNSITIDDGPLIIEQDNVK